jgi:hypothetical protein
MRTDAQAGGAGALRWRRPRLGLPRPSGIRNGGLLLVLVALAAVMALVDKPPEPGAGRSLPGVLQHLPPPAGITALPPVVEQPPAPPDTAGVSAPAGSGARPASVDRAHPNRQHPRPSRPASAGAPSGGAASRPVDGGTGGQGGGNGTSQPPVTTPPVTAPVARVQVPPVNVRVKPPALLGRDLPEVRAETPSVTVDVPRLTATP